MNDSETRRLEMFIRVRQFGSEHADVFTANTRGSEVLAELSRVITELEEHAAKQSSSKRASKEGTTLKNVACSELREDLEAISRTARALALNTPGLDDKFRLPRNVGVQGWLVAARSFAQDAEPLKAEFIRRGMPADFLEDLQSDIETLEASINSKAQKRGMQVASTVAIDEAIERGMNAVRELDVIVRNVFRQDPATLAQWTSASHTQRISHRSPETPSPQPAPAKV